MWRAQRQCVSHQAIVAPGCGSGTTAGGLFSVGIIPSQPLRSSNAVIINDTKERATVVGFIAT